MSKRLWALLALLFIAAAGFMLIGAVGNWDFLLGFRGARLAALILVGAALSVATVLFQTITGNRILTPSILGFDALFVLILSLQVWAFGAAGRAMISATVLFALNAALMAALGLGLFAILRRGGRGDMIKLVLCGVVLGILIRSVASFLQRMIDPSEFQTVQAASFARFTYVETLPLMLSIAVALPVLAGAWAMRHRLDILALGPDVAISLGEDPHKGQQHALVLICLLVASSTALAGPISAGMSGPSSFFGLIVSALAYRFLPVPHHSVLLPGAALIGAITLVAGQTIMERLFALNTPLPVVIELVGGLFFLALVLGQVRAARKVGV
ncbi:MAG: iron chelate uptake ABC transporter family permease subunit [Paracoccaceae bacterium]